jgi:hypothetical protein
MSLVAVTSVKNTKRQMEKQRVTMKILLTWSTRKPSDAVLHKEALVFDNVKLVTRSYK